MVAVPIYSAATLYHDWRAAIAGRRLRRHWYVSCSAWLGMAAIICHDSSSISGEFAGCKAGF